MAAAGGLYYDPLSGVGKSMSEPTLASNPPATNPYVGPVTFEYADRERYFGREREARELLSLVTAERLVLFYAQSGAGKSSLLNTRLVPGLREQSRYLVLPIGRIGGELPVRVTDVENIYAFNLMLSLDRHSQAQQVQPEQADVAQSADPKRFAQLSLPYFLDGLRTADGIHYEYDEGVAQRAAVRRHESASSTSSRNQPTHVLIIDQFEEMITTHPQRWRERAIFFQQLADAMTADPLLWVVLTLREDFVAALDPFAGLVPGHLTTRFYMERMGIAAALQAVKLPAERHNRPFTDEAAQTLVDNLCQVKVAGQQKTFPGQYVEPVQLQVVCYQLWENLEDDKVKGRQGDKVVSHAESSPHPSAGSRQDPITSSPRQNNITLDDLRRSGDVDTALADFYERAIAIDLASVNDAENVDVSERMLRQWFDDELITDANTRGTVFRAADETVGMPNWIVDALQRQFLLRTELRAGGIWVELVHDRFVEPIQRANRAWHDRYVNPLTQAHQRWLDGGQRDELMMSALDLAEAQSFADQNPLEVTAEEIQFLQRSREHVAEEERLTREREAARQQQLDHERQLVALERRRAEESEANERRLRWFVAGLGLALLVAAIVTWIAIVQSNIATARALVTQARNRSDLRLATLLALEAESIAPAAPEASLFLTHDLLERNRLLYVNTLTEYTGHSDWVLSVVWSPDGRSLASGSDDNTIKLWDVESGETLQTLTGHSSSVRSVAWSPDGRSLASGSDDSSIKVWDVENGKTLQTLTGHSGWVRSVVWSPDGRSLASGSDDSSIKVWDVERGETLQTLTGHSSSVRSVAWSPDGRSLASGSSDNTIKVWDVESGETL
ncbi:hypothetical protein KFU94_48985 [Chloroflexi bacterium TSY]|nr:hypothetical protein [Chloroflexi bacterium TSY]